MCHCEKNLLKGLIKAFRVYSMVEFLGSDPLCRLSFELLKQRSHLAGLDAESTRTPSASIVQVHDRL